MFINLLDRVSNCLVLFYIKMGKKVIVRKGTQVPLSLSQPPNFSAVCIDYSVVFPHINLGGFWFDFFCVCVCEVFFVFSRSNLTNGPSPNSVEKVDFLGFQFNFVVILYLKVSQHYLKIQNSDISLLCVRNKNNNNKKKAGEAMRKKQDMLGEKMET